MLSSKVKFSADRQMDRQTDGLTDTGKTICPPVYLALIRVETIMGKGENTDYQHLLLFQ